MVKVRVRRTQKSTIIVIGTATEHFCPQVVHPFVAGLMGYRTKSPGKTRPLLLKSGKIPDCRFILINSPRFDQQDGADICLSQSAGNHTTCAATPDDQEVTLFEICLICSRCLCPDFTFWRLLTLNFSNINIIFSIVGKLLNNAGMKIDE